ncbi:hypothetical protein M422DRAFT_66289 [Sphaerobolus stellatus SS14]|nr:hypothetical protein M422DRAFT_66289 [Sphaerobolus stellatus SS14]
MSWSSLTKRLFAITLALSTLSRVIAQAESLVQCSTASWTSNDEGEQPCLVAIALGQACTGAAYSLTPLKTNHSGYSGPQTMSESNPCICSTVTYSMIAACAICQSGGFFSWSQWMENCNTKDINAEKFPIAIPPGVTVPAWAYLNVSGTGTFDTNQASQIAVAHNIPDVNGTNVPNFATAQASHHSSNTGAIAGGVVGGVVGLLLIVVGGLILYRKRQRNVKVQRSDIVAGLEEQAAMVQPVSYVVPNVHSTPMRLYEPNLAQSHALGHHLQSYRIQRLYQPPSRT